MTNNYSLHNDKVKSLWSMFNQGKAERVPVIVGVSSRFILLSEFAKAKGITFEEYHNNPETMFTIQLELERFRKFEIDDDTQKGVPEDGWTISVDLQNVYEAAWFGAEVIFPKDNVPDTISFLDDNNKYNFIEKPFPDPFSGIMGHAKRCVEYFREQADHIKYLDAPITGIEACALWTDGPFTVACNLRGAENFCMDMIAEPEYALSLLDYITDATIMRVKAWRKFLGLPEKVPGWGFAEMI